MNQILLKMPSLRGEYELGRSTVYDLMAKGKFPRPIKTGGTRGVAWIKAEIDQWVADRVAERDAQKGVRHA